MAARAVEAFRSAGPVPREVLGYWAAKELRVGFDYRDVWEEEHDYAFTAAKVMREDVLRALHDELARAFREGETYEVWRSHVEERLSALGWWQPQEVTDPETGRTVEVNPPQRLRTIFDTNMRSARAAGQWDRIQRTRDTHPYLLYQLGPSIEHRAEHVAWHGLLLPVDDSFWETHFPPNGWGCKCHITQVSEARRKQLVRDGIDAPELDEVVDADGNPTGHVQTKKVDVREEAPPVAMRSYTNPRTGATLEVPEGIDPGFGHRPGAGRLGAPPLPAPPAPVASAAGQGAGTAPASATSAARDAARGEVDLAATPAAAREEHGAAIISADPATADGQARVRGAGRRLVQTAFPELRSFDLAQGRPGAAQFEFSQDTALEAFKPGGYVLGDGAILVSPETFGAAREAALHLAAGRPWSSLSFDQQRGYAILVHEEVHGTSPVRPFAYQGAGLVLEEASTEAIARAVLVRAGVLSRGEAAIGALYRDGVAAFLRAVRHHAVGTASMGDADLIARLAERFVVLRRSVATIRTEDSYVERAAAALAVPPSQVQAFGDAIRAIEELFW